MISLLAAWLVGMSDAPQIPLPAPGCTPAAFYCTGPYDVNTEEDDYP